MLKSTSTSTLSRFQTLVSVHADVLRIRVIALLQWKRANEQAPHKPLLLLLALADLLDALVGFDPAHIQWHQAGGPAVVQNGLALCVLHHKLFNCGVFTVLDELTVTVSDLANGAAAVEMHLAPYHGQGLRGSVNREYAPVEA